jgi:hypothetical protein
VCQILSLLYLRRYIAIKEKTKGQWMWMHQKLYIFILWIFHIFKNIFINYYYYHSTVLNWYLYCCIIQPCYSYCLTP